MTNENTIIENTIIDITVIENINTDITKQSIYKTKTRPSPIITNRYKLKLIRQHNKIFCINHY